MSGHFWIVARTKPNREQWAAENVARQGYIPYLPKVMVQRKRLAQAQPLFACYLFVQTSGAWRFLLGTFGVSGIVTIGDTPATIANKIIDDLRAREIDGCIELPLEQKEPFATGAQLRVKGGLFSGYQGIYAGMDPRARVKVLLDFLGRKTHILLAPEMLEAA